MAGKKKPDLAATLIAAIRKSGMTDYALAKASGVAAAVIGRFLKGERDITLATASKLAAVLKLHLAGDDS